MKLIVAKFSETTFRVQLLLFINCMTIRTLYTSSNLHYKIPRTLL